MKRFVLVLAALLLVLAACKLNPPIGPVGSTHIHVDYKVYLNGQDVDFAKREYMVKAPHVHIESMDGDVIHVHATGVTIGEFFRTLGMKFTKDCFVLKPQPKFCTEGDKTLKFYVNGQPNELYDDYLPSDLDQLLISYGSDSPEDIQKQIASVTDKARKESGSGKTMALG